jgi:isochorismate synthase
VPRRDAIVSTAGTPSSRRAATTVRAGRAVRQLRTAADAAAQRARSLGWPVLAWTSVGIPPLDPLDFVERSAAPDPLLWARPDDRLCLAGVGSAWEFSASGEERFTEAEAAWRSVLDQAVGEPPATGDQNGVRAPKPDSVGGPVAFYGFAFTPGMRTSGGQASASGTPGGWISQPWMGYPDALIVIPRVVVSQRGGETRLILAAMVDGRGRFAAEAYERALANVASAVGSGAPVSSATPHRRTMRADTVEPPLPPGLTLTDEFPPAERWKESVRATASAVRTGRLRKAVLARGIRVRARHLDPTAALRRLRADYASCTLFAFARGGRWFLGATPERLVRVRNGEADIAAVAGTAPRGRTVAEDRRFGEMLLASPKDRLEHAIVVEALRESLAGVCTAIDAEGAPCLLTVRNAHHLYTPLRFALRDHQTVLALTGRLHPTPAVGGAPLTDALRWIRDHEGWDRGWYAGPVGWIGRAGDGEAAVAIRCALVHDTEALLFGGCGIVADSDPDQEYVESDLKLRPVAAALATTASPDPHAAAPRGEDI